MTQQERFTAMFAAIDDDGRRFIMVMLEGEHKRVQAARSPVLRLIQGGLSVAPALPVPLTRARAKRSQAAGVRSSLAKD